MYNDPYKSTTSETAPNSWKQNADAVSVSVPATRFLTFKLRDPEMPLCDIPFYIENALDRLAGRIQNASRLQNGTLLIKVDIETPAVRF
jgi:hypothetical protein